MYTLKYFLFLFLVCFNSPLFAQWSVGVSGGATLSFRQWNLIDLADIGYDPGLSYNAALMGEWRAGQVFSLRVEGGYQVWRGSVSYITLHIINATLKDDLKSLSGAILAKITPFKRPNLYFLTGPSAARILVNRGVIKSEDPLPPEQSHTFKFDLKEKGIEPNQYFVNFGLGKAFKFGASGHLTLEARYQLGLSNLSYASTVDARISSLLVNVGYLYQF